MVPVAELRDRSQRWRRLLTIKTSAPLRAFEPLGLGEQPLFSAVDLGNLPRWSPTVVTHGGHRQTCRAGGVPSGNGSWLASSS